MQTASFRGKASLLAAAFAGVLFGGASPAADWTESSVSLQKTRTSNLTEKPRGFGYPFLEETAGGLVAYVQRDFGSVFLRGQLSEAADPLQILLPSEDSHQRIELHAGYDFGRSLGYLRFGEIQNIETGGSTVGTIVGIGVHLSVNRALLLTGEVLHHELEGGRAGAGGLSGETLAIQAAFRF